MLRWISFAVIFLLAAPVLIGTLIAGLPAFGYFPTLGSESFSLAPWQDLFEVPGLLKSIGISLMAGLLTPLIALTLVFLFLASASGSRLDKWIRRLVSPLLSLPHAAAAFGLAFLIAPSGLLSRLISPELSGWERPPDLLIVNDGWGLSLLLGLIAKEIPFLLLMSMAALPQTNSVERVTMARSLGYRPTIAWLKTVAPGLYALVRLPVFAVIVFASATVDVALILGPTLPPTLSVMILNWFNDPDLSYRFLAAAAALLQLCISLSAIGCWIALEKFSSLLWKIWINTGDRSTLEPLCFIAGRFGMPAVLLLTAGSLMALVLNSFAGFWRFPDLLPSSWTLRHWSGSIAELATPLANTLIIGIVATSLAIALVLSALEYERRRGLKMSMAMWLLYLPLLVPQVVFLFGIVVFAESLQLQANLPLVIFGHLLFVLPYVFLSLSEAYRHLDPRWSQIAATLGASSTKSFWRIRIPLLLAPSLTAIAIGMAISISLFLPTQLLGAGRITTITTEAIALSSSGSRNLIAVWSVVQLLLPMLGFIAALFIPRLLWRNRAGMKEIQ
ncbi:MAG: ABC transporter permease [SAR86 cluster bacterium]|uniref:ABC transporter permease n=1 Tax=SAR86 cluster bacterium TaxID=2030880 RepID=A0A2A5AW10_9GAMM|nr:MAG: ABC transporter permease [SAR86 cluster bacterium]